MVGGVRAVGEEDSSDVVDWQQPYRNQYVESQSIAVGLHGTYHGDS